MSTSDRDDLDGLPTIAPASDDIETRRRGGGRRSEMGGGRGGGSTNLVVTNVLIAFIIAGLTACGWFIVAQNEALASVRSGIESVENRLGRIEERLDMTGDALSKTESETQEQISFWESEIRKLWDVSNKRNRDWIQENQRAIASLQQAQAGQRSTLDELNAKATQLTRGLEAQDQMLTQLSQIDSRLSEMLSRQRTLTDRVNTLTQQQAGMERRAKDSEEAIASMDAFRRDVVGRMSRLQDRIDQVSGAGGSEQTIRPTP
ncbi:MAG: hypothetical protein EA417_05350 [Gammaproteobacteria bacterium]|nr:MAG: hypothetical protein EA417_05350 [Gammaproteobacteria bacterium]